MNVFKNIAVLTKIVEYDINTCSNIFERFRTLKIKKRRYLLRKTGFLNGLRGEDFMKLVSAVCVAGLALAILVTVKSRMMATQPVADVAVVTQPVAEVMTPKMTKRVSRVRIPFGTNPPRVVDRDGRPGASIKKRVVIGRILVKTNSGEER